MLKWRKENSELPVEATQSNGILYIPETESEDAGSYICSMDDFLGAQIDSIPARINVKQQTFNIFEYELLWSNFRTFTKLGELQYSKK